MPRHFDDLQLGSLELFCLAADSGSFTAAAALAGVTPAAVSRNVARLEERLGARLFVRTTRQMRLSAAGHAYYLKRRYIPEFHNPLAIIPWQQQQLQENPESWKGY